MYNVYNMFIFAYILKQQNIMEKQITYQIWDMLEWGNYPTKLQDITFKDDFFYYEINYDVVNGEKIVSIFRYLMSDDERQTWQLAPFQDLELKADIIKRFLELLETLEAEKEAELLEQEIENESEYEPDPDEKHDEYKINNN